MYPRFSVVPRITAWAASTSSGPACSGAITRTSISVSLSAPRSTASRRERVFSDGACATMSSLFAMEGVFTPQRAAILKQLLIANRGEIAIRIAQAAAELGIVSVGIHSEDDATSLHVRRVDEVLALTGHGAGAYLDIDGVIAAACKAGCDSVHPGYGFLAE